MGTRMAWEPLSKYLLVFRQFYHSLVHQRNMGPFCLQQLSIKYPVRKRQSDRRNNRKNTRGTNAANHPHTLCTPGVY